MYIDVRLKQAIRFITGTIHLASRNVAVLFFCKPRFAMFHLRKVTASKISTQLYIPYTLQVCVYRVGQGAKKKGVYLKCILRPRLSLFSISRDNLDNVSAKATAAPKLSTDITNRDNIVPVIKLDLLTRGLHPYMAT